MSDVIEVVLITAASLIGLALFVAAGLYAMLTALMSGTTGNGTPWTVSRCDTLCGHPTCSP